eukprot:TRINITY_DN1656_c0_g1_i3.p1 TRINITY_DN1656_c0_g1~~TRINITY_DN1656_c0_g1_i3.p1  ORF type:complete len:273 (-),score=37.52 TRINITY_DN1656_c0_g1_i3:36-854(-)
MALEGLWGRAFVKLGTRCPKDALYEGRDERLLARLGDELRCLHRGGVSATDNELVSLFFRCANDAMCVSTAEEVFVLMRSSFRVSQDVKAALGSLAGYTGDRQPSGVDLILRQWVDIPLESKFRGFVCKGNLTALAQYYHFCYFASVVRDKASIQKRITDLFQQVKPLLHHESYVIDFAVLADRVLVVEIKPFHYSTGAPLFSWKKGSADRQILLHGPFTFRVTETANPDPMERHLAKFWAIFMRAYRGEAQKRGKTSPPLRAVHPNDAARQ